MYLLSATVQLSEQNLQTSVVEMNKQVFLLWNAKNSSEFYWWWKHFRLKNYLHALEQGFRQTPVIIFVRNIIQLLLKVKVFLTGHWDKQTNFGDKRWVKKDININETEVHFYIFWFVVRVL